MNAFEIFEGDRLDQCVSVAIRTDFLRLIAQVLIENDGSNPVIFAFGRQLINAANVVDGYKKLSAYPQLKNFIFSDDQPDKTGEVPGFNAACERADNRRKKDV